jgi:hypothetical protein
VSSERRQRLIVYAVVAALSTVAVVIAVGLYITQYQAPRAHVLNIEGRDYDTSAVARRGTYHALAEAGFRQETGTSFADTSLALLVTEAILRASAPSLVGPAGDAEVEADLLERSGLTEDDGREAFASYLQSAIQDSGLLRYEFYELTAANLLRTLLNEHFEANVEPTAPQVQLSRIRLTTEEEADEVSQLFADGESFADLVLERTSDEAHRGDAGELGWWVVGGLIPEIKETIDGVAAGDIAPVLPSGIFFDLYLVTEREPERELDAGQIATEVRRQFSEWLDGARDQLDHAEDLSSGEADWIRDRILSDVSRSLGG